MPAAEAPARRQARRIGQHAPGAPRKCLWRGGPGVAGARRCRVAVLRRVRAPKSFNGSARPLLRRLIAVRPAAATRAGWGLLEQTFGEVPPGLPGPAAAVARRCRRRRRRPPAWWQCLRTTLLGVLMPARAPTTFRRHAHVADVLRGCTLRRVRGFPGLLQARKRSKSGWEGGEVPLCFVIMACSCRFLFAMNPEGTSQHRLSDSNACCDVESSEILAVRENLQHLST